ncbi:hypothetical protein [Catenulispora rubra]|uniref:hypothetical protein n=1 Tax=Catenulispora rubra TaxID=280293 RepID=UPI001891FAD8|nr:hypothetical protein [Catenulispora rubra]
MNVSSDMAPSARGAKRAHRIGVPLMRSVWHVAQHDVANVPTDGALLLASNHTSFLQGIEGMGRRQKIAAVSEELRVRLAAHVQYARELTGRDG